jgi:hypothetical protein
MDNIISSQSNAPVPLPLGTLNENRYRAMAPIAAGLFFGFMSVGYPFRLSLYLSIRCSGTVTPSWAVPSDCSFSQRFSRAVTRVMSRTCLVESDR